MKNSILILMILASSICLDMYSARPVIEFAYDGAGNRVKKELRIGSKNAPKSTGTESLSEFFSDKKIIIRPNSPIGFLTIEIAGLLDNDSGALDIFSISGDHVANLRVDESITQVDMSGMQSGIYILTITLNGKKSNWKIIKE